LLFFLKHFDQVEVFQILNKLLGFLIGNLNQHGFQMIEFCSTKFLKSQRKAKKLISANSFSQFLGAFIRPMMH